MSKYANPPVVADAPPWGNSLLRDLLQWVRSIMRGPTMRDVYTLATLPDATTWAGTTLPVSDGVGGQPTVTAIGGQWRYQDGTPA
jgi:hypothetical protein